jgi:hypothetical protein
LVDHRKTWGKRDTPITAVEADRVCKSCLLPLGKKDISVFERYAILGENPHLHILPSVPETEDPG